MARVNIPVTKFVANDNVLSPAGVTPDASDGNMIDPAASWPGATLEQTVVRVVNGATDAVMTFSAGSQPLANAGGQGDLEVTVAADTTRYFGPFESARFSQDDGKLYVDVDVATNVTVTAFVLPKV